MSRQIRRKLRCKPQLTSISQDQIARFFSNVQKTETCWLWIGYRNRRNYGVFSFRDYPFAAHRVSFFLANGTIDPSKCVCHRCDNPPCVNPAHLFEGSNKENSVDAMVKGRLAKGEQNGFSKLNKTQVLEILAKYKPHKYKVKTLALEYGVSRRAIESIIYGWRWAHVTRKAA